METVMKGHFSEPETYAAWSRNADIRYRSTSGGVFTELARVIINKGGIVSGARYNDECKVEHCIVDSIEGLEAIRQSKYMSSDPKNIYREIKEALSAGRLVGYCGSPCQVAGLYSFLGHDYDNLITIDFICRGMNSPKAFISWLKEEEKLENSRAIKVWFKYKDGGWKSSPRRTRIDFEDGHNVVYEGKKNLFMYGYLSSNLYIRPCCGNCRFKGVPRQGDITLADFWGIEKELDDDKGTSLILINSSKGVSLLEEAIDNLVIHHRDFREIFQGNPMFSQSALVPENAHQFLTDLDNMSFSEALRKYKGHPDQLGKRNVFGKMKNKLRHILSKM